MIEIMFYVMSSVALIVMAIYATTEKEMAALLYKENKELLRLLDRAVSKLELVAGLATPPTTKPTSPKKPSNSFGQAIKAKRKEKGMETKELAEIAGVSASLISKLEHGRILPTIKTANKIIKAL